jgi:hypothetical protein
MDAGGICTHNLSGASGLLPLLSYGPVIGKVGVAPTTSSFRTKRAPVALLPSGVAKVETVERSPCPDLHRALVVTGHVRRYLRFRGACSSRDLHPETPLPQSGDSAGSSRGARVEKNVREAERCSSRDLHPEPPLPQSGDSARWSRGACRDMKTTRMPPPGIAPSSRG